MLLDQSSDPQSWVLKALREAGNTLISELHGLDEETLRRRPSDGDLSLKETAAHLRDAEDLAFKQMTAIYEGRNVLPAWDIDILPLERDYLSGDVSRVIAEFRALRRETTALLWSVSERQWNGAGRHPYRGDVTLGQVARELAQHDLDHLWQVRRLKFHLGARARSRSTRRRSEDRW